MLFERVGEDLIVSVHSPNPVTDEEWDGLIAAANETIEKYGRLRVLVRSEGMGGPNGLQRAKLEALAARAEIKAVVLTDSKILRGVATALSWVKGMSIRPLAPDDRAGAIAYLGLTESQGLEAFAVMDGLRPRVG